MLEVALVVTKPPDALLPIAVGEVIVAETVAPERAVKVPELVLLYWPSFTVPVALLEMFPVPVIALFELERSSVPLTFIFSTIISPVPTYSVEALSNELGAPLISMTSV